MDPNLLVGDRLFVSKYSYGFSRHSLPFSPSAYQGRFFAKYPERGDVVVFKTPADNRTDYIKRVIGLPGDTIQIIDKVLFLNDKKIEQEKINSPSVAKCGEEYFETNIFQEKLPNGKKYISTYSINNSYLNSDKFNVPNDHYFFLGDNRDCSKDSRFLSEVGYVHKNNLVGKARILFFSSNPKKGSILAFWKWKNIMRFDRFLKKIN